MIKGIVRQIDKQGRVVIPIGFRKRLKIEDLDEVEIYQEDEFILIRKHYPEDDVCPCCGKPLNNKKELFNEI